MRNVRDPMKKFTNYKNVYPYTQALPPALKDQVSGKGDRRKRMSIYNNYNYICIYKVGMG